VMLFLFSCFKVESRTPEQYFSPEKYCEAVPRAHERGGANATRGRLSPWAHDKKIKIILNKA